MRTIKSNKSIFTVFIILTITITTIVVLALWKPKFDTQSSTYDYYSVLSKIAGLNSKGGLLVLKSSEINSILNLYFKGGIKQGNLTFENVYTEIKNGFIYFYVPSTYNKISFTISLICSLKIEDNKAIINCNKLMIGKLPIPDSFINKKINGQIEDGIYVQSGKIIIDLKNYPVKIASATVSIDSLNLKFNTIASSDSVSDTQTKISDTQKQTENSNVSKSSSAIIENNNNSSNNNTISNSQDINTDKDNALKIAEANINKSALLARTAGGKEIINIIKNILDKVSKDPDYNYKTEEVFAIEKYYELPSDEQEDVRNAILNNFNQSFLSKLINDFGL